MKEMLKAIYKSVEDTGWDNSLGDLPDGPHCFIGHQSRVARLGLSNDLEIVSDYIATFIPQLYNTPVRYPLGTRNLEANGMNKEKALAIIATAIAALPGDDSEINSRPDVSVRTVAQDGPQEDVQREVSRLEFCDLEGCRRCDTIRAIDEELARRSDR